MRPLVVGLCEGPSGVFLVRDGELTSRALSIGHLESIVRGRDVVVSSLRRCGPLARRVLRRSAARFYDASIVPCKSLSHALEAVERRVVDLKGDAHPLGSIVPPHELEAVVSATPQLWLASRALLNESLAASFLYDAEDNLVKTGPGFLARAEFKMRASVTERVGARGAFKFCSIPRADRTRVTPKAPSIHEIVSVDLNAADCRSIIGLDRRLSERYGSDADMHARTAELVFGTRDERMRRVAKASFNAIAYGGGPTAVAEATELSIDRATRCLELFHERLPELFETRARVVREVRADGMLYSHLTGAIDCAGAEHDGAILARVAQTASSRAFLGAVSFVCAIDDGSLQLLFTVNDEMVLEAEPASFEAIASAATLGATAAVGHECFVKLDHGPSYGEFERWTSKS